MIPLRWYNHAFILGLSIHYEILSLTYLGAERLKVLRQRPLTRKFTSTVKFDEFSSPDDPLLVHHWKASHSRPVTGCTRKI